MPSVGWHSLLRRKTGLISLNLGHLIDQQANYGGSLIDTGNAPHAALLRAAKTTVDAQSTDQALAQARDKSPATGDNRIPHTGEAVITAAAQDGLLASGGPINLALNAQARGCTPARPSGWWRPPPAPTTPPRRHAATGLSIIAAQGAIDAQAQSDEIKVQAKEQLTLQNQAAAARTTPP